MHRFRSILFISLPLFATHLQAATMGEMMLYDENKAPVKITYEQKNGYAMVEGDIILAKIKELKLQGAVVCTKMGGFRWKHGIVPFKLSEDLPIKNKMAVLQAILYLQQNTPVEFIELTSKNIAEYKDYIAFIPAEGTTCSSFVGRKGGQQEINLAPRCTTMNTVHEISHALGLWHEQSRSDRDDYIQIVWENIEPDHRFNFDQHLGNSKNIGSYDYQSLMHYGPYAFSKNGEKTILPLQEDAIIGQREQLSEKDIAAIQAMYPEQ